MLSLRVPSCIFSVCFGLSLCCFAPPASADDIDLTHHEFKYYRNYELYKNAPKLKKYPEKIKLKKIAQELKISPKCLKQAIQKAKSLPASYKQDMIKAMEQALQTTPLRNRIKEVNLNTDSDRAVLFVKWRAQNPLEFDKEACWAAYAAKTSVPIASLLIVWAVNSTDQPVFSAKAEHSVIEKIKNRRIKSFASTRYIKMFEDVKRNIQTNKQ